MSNKGSRRFLFDTALKAQGLDFGRQFSAALQNQALSAETLAQLQRTLLSEVIEKAAIRNATYARILSERSGLPLEHARNAGIDTLPTLSKDDLAAVSAEVYSQRPSGFPVTKRTSGSSGRPLSILKPRSGLAKELAVTWRAYGWYGVSPGDRYVRIWGRPIDPSKRIHALIKRLALNAVQLSAFDVSPDTLRERLAVIKAARPRMIYGYASALRELGHFATGARIPLPSSIRAVVSTAEPLDESTRIQIETAFGGPCRNEYGCSEVGSIAHECPEGRMHVMADHLLAEVLAPGGTVHPFGDGELVLTDLCNTLTPVIRYRVGDYCMLSPSDACKCGLPLPVISDIRGRVEDAITMPDGTRHHPAKICYIVDEIDKPFKCVQQFQVVQLSPNEFELKVVPEGEFPQAAFRTRANELFRMYLGLDAEVKLTAVPAIARETSGKYRIVVSQVNRLASRSSPES